MCLPVGVISTVLDTISEDGIILTVRITTLKMVIVV